MPGYRRKNEPELLKDILESYTVPPLQKLAALVGTERPTRKAELVNLLHRELHDAGHLKAIWDKLDSLQQAAVAEIVYSRGLEFDLFAFRAKYGKDPDWGASSRYGEMEKPSLLRLLIYAGTMPRDLKEMLKVFVPPPHAVKIHTVDEPPTTLSQTERLFD
jgi:hypothetical protein